MRSKTLFVVCLLLGACGRYASAQEYNDNGQSGMYGYTSIYYDPNTQTVTAYSETDSYGSADYFYTPTVSLASNGQWTTATAYAGQPHVEVTLSYQGAAGGTYLARGQHSATLMQQGYYYTNYNYSYGYNDMLGLTAWQLLA